MNKANAGQFEDIVFIALSQVGKQKTTPAPAGYSLEFLEFVKEVNEIAKSVHIHNVWVVVSACLNEHFPIEGESEQWDAGNLGSLHFYHNNTNVSVGGV